MTPKRLAALENAEAAHLRDAGILLFGIAGGLSVIAIALILAWTR